MAVHSPLNAFSFDISLIEIGQEIKLLEHLKKFLDHLVYVYVLVKFNEKLKIMNNSYLFNEFVCKLGFFGMSGPD
jgi:hypothetical protein